MARNKIPFAALGYAADAEMGFELATPTTMVVANDGYIDAADVDDALWLKFTLTARTTGSTITIKAGNGPRSGLGDYVWTSLTDGAADVTLGPLETARFKWLSGTTDYKGRIHVDYSAAPLAGRVQGFKSR